MSQTRNQIQTLVSGMAPVTRSRATPQALVLDTLCLLLDVLAPKLRPVSVTYGGRDGVFGRGGSWHCPVPTTTTPVPAYPR